MEPLQILSFLGIGALLGAAGQGARALVGIKKNFKKKEKWFDLKRLIVSLIIGAVAGTLTSIFLIDEPINKTLLLSLVASGYAGTDVIESFVRKHIKHPN